MKRYLTLSLILNVILVLFIAGRSLYYRNWARINASQIERDLDIRLNPVIDIMKTIPVTPSDTVLVGNSLMLEFPTTYKKFAIAGARCRHVLPLLDHAKNAKLIYLEVGINDIVNTSVDTLKENVLKMMSPNVVIHSTLPVGGIYSDYNDEVIQYNKWLDSACKARGVRFENVYHLFEKGGQLNPAFTADGLHLNVTGYMIWKQHNKLQ